MHKNCDLKVKNAFYPSWTIDIKNICDLAFDDGFANKYSFLWLCRCTELSKRQFFSFATTMTRPRNRALFYWNAETIPKTLISRCLKGVATTNKNILHQQFWGLKSWWLCRGNVVECPALLLYLNSCYLGCKCWPARSVWGQSDPPADSLWTAPLLWNIYSYKQPMSLYDMHRRKI